MRTPEASIAPAWAEAIQNARPEDTIITTSFSGKPGRAIENQYTKAAHDDSNPVPAPYPIQRSLTKEMREQATKSNDIDYMQAWAGQAAALAQAKTAQDLVTQIWVETQELFG